MLSITGLYCERDDRVLFRDLDFSVDKGDIWQIQGSNGSGKTTLLRILTGLNHDFSGDIFWQGEPIARRREEFNRDLFYLGHAPAINKTLTPTENLRWFCASRGVPARDRIVEALNSFKLYGYDDIPCYQLSAGQQRRVSLARMQLTGAGLWILDEPFTALDKQGVADLEVFLSAHAAKGGMVLLTTHHNLGIRVQPKVIDLDAMAGQSVAEI